MSSRLVNVRLDEERLRKARKLRESGVALSDLIRGAIDEQYEKLAETRKPRNIAAMMAELDAKYPINANDLPPRDYDVHDRKQAAAAIRKHLKAKRPRIS
jgi:hypothetical protein